MATLNSPITNTHNPDSLQNVSVLGYQPMFYEWTHLDVNHGLWFKSVGYSVFVVDVWKHTFAVWGMVDGKCVQTSTMKRVTSLKLLPLAESLNPPPMVEYDIYDLLMQVTAHYEVID
jgi:hypothetical protein